jgi:hypothetical protein
MIILKTKHNLGCLHPFCDRMPLHANRCSMLRQSWFHASKQIAYPAISLLQKTWIRPCAPHVVALTRAQASTSSRISSVLAVPTNLLSFPVVLTIECSQIDNFNFARRSLQLISMITFYKSAGRFASLRFIKSHCYNFCPDQTILLGYPPSLSNQTFIDL